MAQEVTPAAHAAAPGSRVPDLGFDVEREPLDVVRIMEAIRAHADEARARGQLTLEEAEALARTRIRASARTAYIDPMLLERFLRGGHDWNTATDYLLRTHRAGVAGRLGLLLKRIVRPLVRLYTDHLLNRQTQINQYFCHLLHDTIRDEVRLEARIVALERRCAQLEARAGGREVA